MSRHSKRNNCQQRKNTKSRKIGRNQKKRNNHIRKRKTRNQRKRRGGVLTITSPQIQELADRNVIFIAEDALLQSNSTDVSEKFYKNFWTEFKASNFVLDENVKKMIPTNQRDIFYIFAGGFGATYKYDYNIQPPKTLTIEGEEYRQQRVHALTNELNASGTFVVKIMKKQICDEDDLYSGLIETLRSQRLKHPLFFLGTPFKACCIEDPQPIAEGECSINDKKYTYLYALQYSSSNITKNGKILCSLSDIINNLDYTKQEQILKFVQTVFFILLVQFNYLTKLGLLHQDFKGGNCLVNNYGLPLIIDFGSIKAYKDTQIESKLNDPTNYETIENNKYCHYPCFRGGVTPPYDSLLWYKEFDGRDTQQIKQCVTFSNDYWSLCMTMYEMLHKKTLYSVLDEILLEEYNTYCNGIKETVENQLRIPLFKEGIHFNDHICAFDKFFNTCGSGQEIACDDDTRILCANEIKKDDYDVSKRYIILRDVEELKEMYARIKKDDYMHGHCMYSLARYLINKDRAVFPPDRHNNVVISNALALYNERVINKPMTDDVKQFTMGLLTMFENMLDEVYVINNNFATTYLKLSGLLGTVYYKGQNKEEIETHLNTLFNEYTEREINTPFESIGSALLNARYTSYDSEFRIALDHYDSSVLKHENLSTLLK